jgi:hypothetical protein
MATIRVQTKVGRHVVTVEAATTTDVIKAVSEFSEMPNQCPHCKGTDLALKHREAKGYDFYSLKCNGEGCGRELRFGQTKGTLRLFPKQWEVPRYGSGDADHGEPGY